MQSKKKAFSSLMEEFDSHEILEAVDNYDEIRSLVDDRDDCKPPEVRDKLLRLHKMISNEHMTHKGETVWELANEIEDDIYNIQEAVENILDVLGKITDSAPDDDDEEAEDDE